MTTQKPKIFWLEDDQLLGKILSKEMSHSEFDLMLAKSGEEAMDLLKNNIPRVIMVDIMLPGKMNGFDVLREVCLDPRFKDTPKIVLSNLSKPSDLDRAKELGATKFLVKADTSLEQIMTELRAQCI